MVWLIDQSTPTWFNIVMVLMHLYFILSVAWSAGREIEKKRYHYAGLAITMWFFLIGALFMKAVFVQIERGI